MTRGLPLAIRLTRAALARHDRFVALVERAVEVRRADAAEAFHAFAFKADEDAFARGLLERCPQRWVYRCNQRASCGDFVVVDMASPWPARRRAWVVELKLGAAPRLGAGGVGVQLTRAAEVVASLDVRTAEAPFATVVGDGAALIAWLRRPRAAP